MMCSFWGFFQEGSYVGSSLIGCAYSRSMNGAAGLLTAVFWESDDGHDYKVSSEICPVGSNLTKGEAAEFLRRNTVPRLHGLRVRLPEGRSGPYLVMTPYAGTIGGYVNSGFNSDDLTAYNETTPFHLLAGRVDQSIRYEGDGSVHLDTHGWGKASGIFEAIRDEGNDIGGPIVFSLVHVQAKRDAKRKGICE